MEDITTSPRIGAPLWLVSVFLLLALAAGGGGGAILLIRLHSSSPSPAGKSKPRDGYGIYENCDPHVGSLCATRLTDIAAGGFSEVMDYSAFSSDTTIDDDLAYAASAQQLGLSMIWPVDDFIYTAGNATDVLQRYPRLVASIAASGLCAHPVTSNYWLVVCMTIITSDHPGTWGYYIGDELPASDEPRVRHIVDAILDCNKTALRLFVAQDPGGYLNSSQVEAYGRYYYDGYHAAPDASVIAQDYYPIGTSQQASAVTTTGQIAAALHAFATREGISYGMALQAHSLSEYKRLYPWCTSAGACPYPTAGQEQAMQSAVLAQGDPQIIMWYSYFDLVNSGNYTKHWTDLTSVVGGVPEPPVTTPPTKTPCVLVCSTVLRQPEPDALKPLVYGIH